MLKRTFIHLPGIGSKTEQKLWDQGIYSWEDFLSTNKEILGKNKTSTVTALLRESLQNLKNPKYFASRLPRNQYWRLYPFFKNRIAFVDIETTGLFPGFNEITTICLYDGIKSYTYIRNRNLSDFATDIFNYDIIATYNGTFFDIPFIEWQFKIKIDLIHIDLMYALRSLGFSGGLKNCEIMLGLDRGELAGINGYTAVLLWYYHDEFDSEEALNTLLAYNMEDVINLEALLIKVYNMRLLKLNTFQDLILEEAQKPNPLKAGIQFYSKFKNLEWYRRKVAPWEFEKSERELS